MKNTIYSLSNFYLKSTLLVLILIIATNNGQSQGNSKVAWQEVDKGLMLGTLSASKKSSHGDGKITILKIDPKLYGFQIHSAKEKDSPILTAPQWAKNKNLIAVINAGMFAGDGETNMGYMKHYDFVNNARLNKDNAILAFNPKKSDLPPFQIIDLKCQNWEHLKSQYNSYSQSIRMVDCYQNNRWAQQPKKWSISVMGTDKIGNALFIFCRSPYTVHDFIDFLLKSDLNLKNAMYLEGGPEASFYLNHKGFRVEKFGSYETGFNENDENPTFWQIPNIIAVVHK